MTETEYSKLSSEEKRIDLYLRQKNLLNDFLERNAISKEQNKLSGRNSIQTGKRGKCVRQDEKAHS